MSKAKLSSEQTDLFDYTPHSVEAAVPAGRNDTASETAVPDRSTAPPYLTVQEVAYRLRISVPTVWRWAREGKFPKPVLIGPRTTRWLLEDLETYEQSLRHGAEP